MSVLIYNGYVLGGASYVMCVCCVGISHWCLNPIYGEGYTYNFFLFRVNKINK